MQVPLVRRALIAKSCIAQHNCPHQRLPYSHTSSHRNAKNNKNVKKQNTTRLWQRQCAKLARLTCWECWEQTSKNWGNPLANKALRPQKKILPPQTQYWQKCSNTFDYFQILTSFKIDAILQRMNIHRTRRCTSLTLKNYQLPFLLWHPAVKEVIKCKTGVEMGASLAQRDALWNLVGGFV